MNVFGVEFPQVALSQDEKVALEPYLFTKRGKRRTVLDTEAALIPPYPTRRFISYLDGGVVPSGWITFLYRNGKLVEYLSSYEFILHINGETNPTLNLSTAKYYAAMILDTLADGPNGEILVGSATSKEIYEAFGYRSAPLVVDSHRASLRVTGFLKAYDRRVFRCELDVDNTGTVDWHAMVWNSSPRLTSLAAQVIR